MQGLPVNLITLYKDRDAFFVFLLSLIVLVSTLCTGFFFLFFRVIMQAYSASPTVQTSGVYLVFGKQLVNGVLDDDYRMRLERLLGLPKRLTFLLGGTTGNATCSEAQAGYDFLCVKGFPGSDLRLETSSTTTLENLRNARKILVDYNLGKAIVISNRYHLRRCQALASNLNIPHALCAAEVSFVINKENLFKCLSEAFYLHWFYSGKYWAWVTRNQRMLKRIT